MPFVDFAPQPLAPDEEKLAELILYVAERCSEDADFGATKLNKILHASDFLAYAMFGKPITGTEYFRLDRGPSARRMMPVRAYLEANDRLAIQKTQRFGFTQHRPVPLEDADLSMFEAREIALVESVIRAFEGKNARDVSAASHVNKISAGWQLTEDRETIPYYSVFVSPSRPSQASQARARELADGHGWAT